MKVVNRHYIYALLTAFIACSPQSAEVNDIVEVITEYSELEEMLLKEPDKTWVVNFWATTCPPCLKEMPHFRELEREFVNADLKVLLVSLDLERHLDQRVYPFIQKHDITPQVVLLADQNYSAWTDEIDPSWFGALPATLILCEGKRKFRFGMYESYHQLKTDLVDLMEPQLIRNE